MLETFPHNEFIVANPTYYRIQAILRDLAITYPLTSFWVLPLDGVPSLHQIMLMTISSAATTSPNRRGLSIVSTSGRNYKAESCSSHSFMEAFFLYRNTVLMACKYG